jgi:uncharacterized membrane protein YdcZ (DUF606 family)
VLLLFAIVAGACLPIQAGINAGLAQFVGGPVIGGALLVLLF